MIDSPSTRGTKLRHPLAVIAEMQSELLRRRRQQSSEIADDIAVVDLERIQTRLGSVLRLTTHQQAVELCIKRLEALMWMAKRYKPSVTRRLLFDRLYRERIATRKEFKLTVVK